MLEQIKNIGAILGYIATAIGLFAVIRTAVMTRTKKYVEETAGTEESSRIQSAFDSRLTDLETKFIEFIERDSQFKAKMDSHIATQQNVDRKLMANIIEKLYYQNRDVKTLDSNEFRRLTEVYAIYHNPPVNGNSYISELYRIMMEWERV